MFAHLWVKLEEQIGAASGTRSSSCGSPGQESDATASVPAASILAWDPEYYSAHVRMTDYRDNELTSLEPCPQKRLLTRNASTQPASSPPVLVVPPVQPTTMPHCPPSTPLAGPLSIYLYQSLPVLWLPRNDSELPEKGTAVVALQDQNLHLLI